MPTRYFARIDRKQVGPLTMAELLNAGIRPTTYVWCKGMADWTRASDVPDICRAMRRALAGLDPETGLERQQTVDVASDVPPAKIFSPENPPANRREMAEYLRQAIEESERNSREDYTVPPQGVSIFMAVVVTILCFPITGLVAIWFAYRCKLHWAQSRQLPKGSPERGDLQRRAHDDARIFRMMLGITFSIGIIMVGLALSRTLL